MQVTAALTELAVRSVQSALRYLLRQEVARARIEPPDTERPEQDSGLIVLAMGKMGAGELNYSSDIDLIVFFDSAAPTLADDIEPHPFLSGSRRACRGCCNSAAVAAMCSGSICGCGRIRPRLRSRSRPTRHGIITNGKGGTWERAAMIKARPCAGDVKAGEAFLAELAPFVWRKHLDFAALADVHDMKRQMQTYRGQTEIAVEGHNVKIGRGGIREIEFFAQTQQWIAGGRHPKLRVRPTLEALDVLASNNWITFEARDQMSAPICFCAGSSTACRWWPMSRPIPCLKAPRRWNGLPASSDMKAALSLAKDLLGHLTIVQGHYGKLFEGDPAGHRKAAGG